MPIIFWFLTLRALFRPSTVPWLALSSPSFAVNISQEETGEKKQTHTYGKHFMETTSDFQGDFWGF
jgi:hypothetical protein